MKRIVSGASLVTLLAAIAVMSIVQILQTAREKNFMKICREAERNESYCQERWAKAKWGSLPVNRGQ
jgi:uncharacterized protein YfaQ (DUF2300 family)